jgi:hypothetical protein
MCGFAVGLIGSFWLAGLFGFSPPIVWSALVLLFLIGVLFLERPKLFLFILFGYHTFFFNGRLFGVFDWGIPFAGMLDEAILAAPLAMIVMKGIHRQLPKSGSIFPAVYLILAALSFVVNDGPILNAMKTTLSYGKFYLFWYFARAIGPWSDKEKRLWMWLIVAMAFIQFPANVAWQRHIIAVRHPDYSIGTLGNAHLVGYFSVIALFMIAGWLLSWRGRSVAGLIAVLVMSVIIGYNLIFLTDTKHVLFVVPLAALPVLMFPAIKGGKKTAFVLFTGVFVAASWIYLSSVLETSWRDLSYRVVNSVKYSGKGSMFRTITRELPHEVPVAAIFGAGPGNFCSATALHSFRPLTNKYVLPYVLRALKSGGSAADSSVVGSPMTSFYTLIGEFGPLVCLAYCWFWFKVVRRLLRLAIRDRTFTFEAGQRLAVVSGLICVFLTGWLVEIYHIGILILPLWTMAGIYWDDQVPQPAPEPAVRKPLPPGMIRFNQMNARL